MVDIWKPLLALLSSHWASLMSHGGNQINISLIKPGSVPQRALVLLEEKETQDFFVLVSALMPSCKCESEFIFPQEV